MEQSFKIEMPEMSREWLCLMKKTVWTSALATGFCAGLTTTSILLMTMTSHHALFVMILASTSIAAWQLTTIVRGRAKLRRMKAELHTLIEIQLTNFKAALEADGVPPVVAAGAVLRVREEMESRIPK